MRIGILVFICFLTFGKCFSQNNFNCWLPEKFVKAALEKNPESKKYLFPIEGFQSFANKPCIAFQYGELKPVQTKRIDTAGIVKYELLNLYSHVNTYYDSTGLVQKLKKSKVYVSMVGKKLMIEIIENEKKDEIIFIDKIEGYNFRDIRKSQEYLLKKKK